MLAKQVHNSPTIIQFKFELCIIQRYNLFEIKRFDLVLHFCIPRFFIKKMQINWLFWKKILIWNIKSLLYIDFFSKWAIPHMTLWVRWAKKRKLPLVAKYPHLLSDWTNIKTFYFQIFCLKKYESQIRGSFISDYHIRLYWVHFCIPRFFIKKMQINWLFWKKILIWNIKSLLYIDFFSKWKPPQICTPIIFTFVYGNLQNKTVTKILG
jgi:hypothetical protein